MSFPAKCVPSRGNIGCGSAMRVDVAGPGSCDENASAISGALRIEIADLLNDELHLGICKSGMYRDAQCVLIQLLAILQTHVCLLIEWVQVQRMIPKRRVYAFLEKIMREVVTPRSADAISEVRVSIA